MTELIRPCLYDAHHAAFTVSAASADQGPATRCDLVGPVCETADFLARDCLLPELKAGDLVAIRSAGAYAASMGSTYNSRCRPPEVLIENRTPFMIRRRESLEELWALESAESIINV